MGAELTSETVLLAAVPCPISIPDADMSAPQWVGKRKGEPFDVQKYHSDWQQKYDAEAECLYLTAMADFSPDLRHLAPEALRERLSARQSAIGKIIRELMPRDAIGSRNWDDGQAGKLLAAMQPAIAGIDRAQIYPSCVFSTSLQFSSQVPYLQAVRQFYRFSEIQFRSKRFSGPEDAPSIEEMIRQMLRLSRDLRPRGVMIQQLVGFVVEHYLANSIQQDILTKPGLTAVQCQRIREIIEQHESACIDGLVEGTRAEYVSSGNSLWALEHGTISFKDVGMENITPKVASAINYNVEWQSLNDLFVFLFNDFIAEPYHAVLNHDRFAERIEQMRHDSTTNIGNSVRVTGKLPHSVLVLLLAPGMSNFREAVARRQVKLDGIKSLLVIRRFELEEGRLPVSLEEAFRSAGAGPIPDDPYFGDQLKFRVVNNSIRVYSTGKDQTDDHAEADWDFGNQPGDFFVEMPVLRN